MQHPYKSCLPMLLKINTLPSTSIPGVGGGVTILSIMVISTLSFPILSPPGPVGKLSPLDRATVNVSPSSDTLSSVAENEKQTGPVELSTSCPVATVVGEKSSAGGSTH